MTFVSWIERHVRTILAVAVALAAAGALAAISLPVGLFPRTTFPRVKISLNAGDRPAEQMLLLVSRPVAEAIHSVPGLQSVRSVTSRGSAEVTADFGWGRNMIQTTQEVDSAVSQIRKSLPADLTYTVRRMDVTVYPVIAYAMTSENLPQSAMRDIARFQILPLISSIPGVARVAVEGGSDEEVHVLIDPHRLAAAGVTVADLTAAIGKSNVLKVVGRLTDHHRLYLVVSTDVLRQLDQVRKVVVRATPGGVVTVGDVAAVTMGAVPHWTVVTEDGRPAVLLNVYEQPGGNVVQIARQVRETFADFQMPPGVKVTRWYDQSRLVTESEGSVRDAVVIGLVLSGLVVLLFLRSWRVTLVTVMVVPITLLITVLVLSVMGLSFNIMTLGGLAAAVALLIDDAIVMIEHVARRAGAPARGGGSAPTGQAAVLPAAREFLSQQSGSSLATIIVFVPLSFLSGVTGAFAKALSVTMAAALLISWLSTVLAVPVLARLIVNFKRWHDPGGEEGRIGRGHRWLLERLFRVPWLLAIGIVPLLVAGYFAYSNVQTGFMPRMDEGGFVLDYHTPPGMSLAETDRELRQVEAILKSIPAVQTFSRRTGLALGGTLSEANSGDFFVLLKTGNRPPISKVMAEVLARVHNEVPGVRLELSQLIEDLIGDLTAVPQPIEIQLYGQDTGTLIAQARKVAGAISKVPGVIAVRDGVVIAGDSLDIEVDPVRAAAEGVDAGMVTSSIETYIAGSVVTRLPRSNREIGVRVMVPPAQRTREEQLAELPIRAPDGHLFPLERIATLRPISGRPQLTREDLRPMFAVTARIEGRGFGAVAADLNKVLHRNGMLGPGVTYKLGGLYRQQQIAFRGLAEVFVAAMIVELMLLLFLYESFRLALIVIVAALLSAVGVFIGLWLTGIALNITAIMGMTMIIGITVEMAIFMVSEYVGLARSAPSREAATEASIKRFRPIAMSTIAAIVTLFPLAIAYNRGAQMQQPLAIAIIAGMLVAFPLLLLAMPVVIALAVRGQE